MNAFHTLRGLARRPAFLILVVVCIASLATLAFVDASSPAGCHNVRGKLYNGTPGRMIGAISGPYYFDRDQVFCFDEELFPIRRVCGRSWVDDKRGTLFFDEYSALDTSEQTGLNGAVLAVVTGGTGSWEGASGHIVLTGYWHDDGQGEWSYSGEVCRP